MTANC